MFLKSSLFIIIFLIENQAYIGFLLITMKKLFLKKKITFYQNKTDLDKRTGCESQLVMSGQSCNV